LDQLKAPVVEALRASGVGLEGLQGVLLAGGSTRLPFLGEFVRSRLTLGKVRVLSVEDVPPEEVAAVGAAYYGRQLVE
jgi:molecular chaperone DnaK (HSP70)